MRLSNNKSRKGIPLIGASAFGISSRTARKRVPCPPQRMKTSGISVIYFRHRKPNKSMVITPRLLACPDQWLSPPALLSTAIILIPPDHQNLVPESDERHWHRKGDRFHSLGLSCPTMHQETATDQQQILFPPVVLF